MAIHHFPNSFYQNPDHRNYFSLSSNPLFSTILTLYLLILLYFPHFFLRLLLSPLFISTLILLLSLLRFGVSEQTNRASNDLNRVETARPGPDPKPIEAKVKAWVDSYRKETPTQPDPVPEPEPEQHGWSEIDHWQSKWDKETESPTTEAGSRPKPEPESEKLASPNQKEEEARQCRLAGPECSPNWDPKPICRENFVEWDVGAPLEVIHEAYEDEEEGDADQNDSLCTVRINRYPSLSRYYPESDMDLDSGSSSSSWDGEFQGIQRWDEEDEEREGLIEIEIGVDRGDDDKGMTKPLELGGQVDEEDNLIEIDISPIRTDYGFY